MEKDCKNQKETSGAQHNAPENLRKAGKEPLPDDSDVVKKKPVRKDQQSSATDESSDTIGIP